MSLQAVDDFRARINQDSELAQAASIAFQGEPVTLVALGAAHGYSFTEAELAESLHRYSAIGELSDYELELVSGGGDQPSNTGKDLGSAKS